MHPNPWDCGGYHGSEQTGWHREPLENKEQTPTFPQPQARFGPAAALPNSASFSAEAITSSRVSPFWTIYSVISFSSPEASPAKVPKTLEERIWEQEIPAKLFFWIKVNSGDSAIVLIWSSINKLSVPVHSSCFSWQDWFSWYYEEGWLYWYLLWRVNNGDCMFVLWKKGAVYKIIPDYF